MIETTVRTFEFTDAEIRQILIDWMRSKSMAYPDYIGDTDCTKWKKSDGGLSVEWTKSFTDLTPTL